MMESQCTNTSVMLDSWSHPSTLLGSGCITWSFWQGDVDQLETVQTKATEVN